MITYNSLKSGIERYFNELVEKRDYTPNKAVALCLYEYETVMSENRHIQLICCALAGNLLAQKSQKVFSGYYNYINKAMSDVNIEELNNMLSINEFNELNNIITFIKKALPKKEIVTDPKIC
jgi:hypothetical protein